MEGFEPPMAESESAALPLGDIPVRIVVALVLSGMHIFQVNFWHYMTESIAKNEVAPILIL